MSSPTLSPHLLAARALTTVWAEHHSPAIRLVVRVFWRHLFAAIRTPHHYATACVMVGVFAAIGHVETGHVLAAFVYAFSETFVSGGAGEG